MTHNDENDIDATSWQLVQALQEDARLPFTELGRRVGMSSPAVAERVRRLEDDGTITGYHAHLDPGRVGLPLRAFVRLNVAGDKCARAARAIQDMSEVLEAHRITGEASYLLQVAVRDVPHLEMLLDRLMPWGSPTTSIVLSSPVVRRSLGPEAKPL